MKQKVLVAGGTGFIGFHVLKSFNPKKYVLHSLSTKYPEKKRKVKNVKYLICDITKKSNLNKKIFINYDHVINLSGYIDHSKKIKTIKSHYNGLKNLVNFFKKKNIKTFMQIGSCLEYGNIKSPQREINYSKPRNYYAFAKSNASKYLVKAGLNFDIPYIILRLYQVYGPNQKFDRLIPFVINSCLNDKKFPCTNGLQVRDFLYVEDLVRLIRIIIQKRERKLIFNVGSGNPIKVKSVIKNISKYIKKGKPNFNAIKMRKDEIKSLYPDIKLVKKKLDWKPKVSLKKGLKKTISFYNAIQ